MNAVVVDKHTDEKQLIKMTSLDIQHVYDKVMAELKGFAAAHTPDDQQSSDLMEKLSEQVQLAFEQTRYGLSVDGRVIADADEFTKVYEGVDNYDPIDERKQQLRTQLADEAVSKLDKLLSKRLRAPDEIAKILDPDAAQAVHNTLSRQRVPAGDTKRPKITASKLTEISRENVRDLETVTRQQYEKLVKLETALSYCAADSSEPS